MYRHLSQGMTEEAERMADYKFIQEIIMMFEYRSSSKPIIIFEVVNRKSPLGSGGCASQ